MARGTTLAQMGQLKLVGTHCQMAVWSTTIVKDGCIMVKLRLMESGITLIQQQARQPMVGISYQIVAKFTMMLTIVAMVKACYMG